MASVGELREAREALLVELAVLARAACCTGSSSSSTTTIGACVTPPIVRALASSGKASSEIEPLNRNSSRNTSGAGDRMLRNERTGSARSQSSGRAGADRARERTIRTTSEASIAFFSAWAAISATAPPISTACATARAAGPRGPTSSSIASSSAGGSTTSRTQKEMMSKPEEPRAAKNSGLSLSRSKSGWATAKVHSTARLRYAQRGVLRPRSRVIPASGRA